MSFELLPEMIEEQALRSDEKFSVVYLGRPACLMQCLAVFFHVSFCLVTLVDAGQRANVTISCASVRQIFL